MLSPHIVKIWGDIMADISKIKIPDGTSLNIKDATAR
jgi:hypothetical protein